MAVSKDLLEWVCKQVKELEERKELLVVKRDKYRKQLEFLNKQVNELEGRIKEALSKHGLSIE